MHVRAAARSAGVTGIPVQGIGRQAYQELEAGDAKGSWQRLRSRRACTCLSSRAAASPIPVMILDGESAGPYHDWQRVTPVLAEDSRRDGTVRHDGRDGAASRQRLLDVHPSWTKYQAVVMNYDAPDERWPAAVKASFEDYMRDGGGLAVVHAADNAFSGWNAFNEMIGVGGWRGRSAQAVRTGSCATANWRPIPSPGPAGSHGRRMPFQVAVRDPSHPITRACRRVWMHQGDELYARLRGPGKNMTVLATAYLRSGEQRHRTRRADADGDRVRQGPRVPHDVGARYRRHELGRLRRHAAARHRVGRHGPGDAEGAGEFPDGDTVRIAPTSRPWIPTTATGSTR